jgi:hypothetical protein
MLEHYAKLSSWEEILRAAEENLSVPSGCCDTGRGNSSESKLHCSPEKRLFPEGYFSIGCHDFMDITNFDLARAKKCCLHEIAPDGKVFPFCLYNILRSLGQTAS